MTVEEIRHRLAAYREARRILSANFTSIQERKSAIAIRDEFVLEAPTMVKFLLKVVDSSTQTS